MSTKRRVVSARKRTPVASKSWKENLRQACLYRARQRRSSPEALTDQDMLSPRLLIEDELRQHGVKLISPCMDRNQQQSTPQKSVDHYISEEELFELLQEVEDEMQRSDAIHLEEMIEIARDEEQYLENQIADYELWEESKMIEGSPVQVLCPICQEANLTNTPNGDIICPNHMDESCSFCLAEGQPVSLFHLRQRLRQACEQHGAHCQNSLCFEITSDTSNLIANCSVCHMTIYI